MSKSKQIRTVTVIVLLVFVLGYIGIYPSVYEYACKTRVYSDIETLSTNYDTANICIIARETKDNIRSYSAGASGVIIGNMDDTYYALTAYHVVIDNCDTDYLIRTTTAPSFKEYKKENPNVALTDYYKQFPVSEIIYTNEESDIAIIKFESSEDLMTVSISDSMPTKGTRVVCIGQNSAQNVKFVKTYGKVTSSKTSAFTTVDGMASNEVLKLNAYGVAGFSGGGIFDENMNLIGINIGGGTDIFGRFKYEAMIPCDQLRNCIAESGLVLN